MRSIHFSRAFHCGSASPNNALQPTVHSLRSFTAAELGRSAAEGRI